MCPSFVLEPLSPHHERAGFACGNTSLDDFIKTKARKEQELGFSAVFIAVAQPKSSAILGYYSLSSHSITVQGIPLDVRKKFPRYPTVPTTLLGRLARRLESRGQGVGEFLLLDALSRALQSSENVGSYAVVVDAIDAAAISFYAKYGFLPTEERHDRLYLPIASIKSLGL
jgi:GNAT superfamily N-acetyltransferase